MISRSNHMNCAMFKIITWVKARSSWLPADASLPILVSRFRRLQIAQRTVDESICFFNINLTGQSRNKEHDDPSWRCNPPSKTANTQECTSNHDIIFGLLEEDWCSSSECKCYTVPYINNHNFFLDALASLDLKLSVSEWGMFFQIFSDLMWCDVI